ncbi:MAG TPA: cytochrome c oxidase subunit II [Longimicrobiales bacterium]
MSAAWAFQRATDGGGAWDDFLNALNAFYRRALTLPPQASTIARDIDGLHYFEITIMFAAAGLIAVVALYFVVRYRRRPGRDPTPRIVAPHWFEMVLYAGLLGLFVLFWVIGFRQYIDLSAPPDSAVDVYVTAKQWMWEFAYPEGPASAGVLYVPAGRPVRLHLTSRDVIHSFFVPDFRIKRDAVPGMYTTAWFQANAPGTHQILCTEMCGVGHSQMLARVVVLRPADFETFLLRRAPAATPTSGRDATPNAPPARGAPLAVIGRAAAARHGCLGCHSIDGTRRTGPSWLGLFGSTQLMADGERIRVTPAYITESMMDPQRRIVAGYPPVMPSFMGQISPAETAAIIEYMRSLADGIPDAEATRP